MEEIEASVIRYIAKMVNLPEGSYKLQQSISPSTTKAKDGSEDN